MGVATEHGKGALRGVPDDHGRPLESLDLIMVNFVFTATVLISFFLFVFS